MDANPFLGVILHSVGGLMSAVFCLPFRYVRHWAWESYWLVGGVFSWVIVPWIVAAITVPDLLGVFRESPTSAVVWTFLFGALWGIGGLTFGLTVRYLGFALGTAMALGYCAAFGTLITPWYEGKLPTIIGSPAGKGVLVGIGICLIGIIIIGMAGHRKEKEFSAASNQGSFGATNFWKGLVVATICGIMSACFAFALGAGKPIGEIAKAHHTATLWLNMPKYIVLMAGGLATNLVWCIGLNLKNGTGGDYLRSTATAEGSETAVPVPRLTNYLFAAAAGTIWYFQFFFYGMGESMMGRFEFSSWSLHMSSIIIFGTLVGITLSEWKGAGKKTMQLMYLGLSVLVGSMVVIGVSNSYANQQKITPPTAAQIAEFVSNTKITIPPTSQPVGWKEERGMDDALWLQIRMPTADLEVFLKNSPFSESKLETSNPYILHLFQEFQSSPPQRYRAGQQTLPNGRVLNLLIDESDAATAVVYLMWHKT